MAEKPVIDNLGNLTNESSAVQSINQNLNRLSEAFTDLLSTTSLGHATMNIPLDMNGQRLINLPAPVLAGDPIRFQDRFLLKGDKGDKGDKGENGLPGGIGVYDAMNYGLIGDGNYHPLSDRFPSLILAKLVYPHATSLTDSIDWCALQAAILLAEAYPGSSERVAGGWSSPSGKTPSVNKPLLLSVPTTGYVGGLIYSTMGTGATVIIGAKEDGGRNTGYKLDFGGFLQIGGNGDPPVYNANGAIGVEVRSMQDSELRIRHCRQFTRAGVYLNSTNNVLFKQHVQGNYIYIGYVAFCGIGLDAQSADPDKAAVQANNIFITNFFSNVYNINLDQPGYFNTNNNTFFIAGLDAVKGGGSNTRIWGWYNKFIVNYVDGVVEQHGRNNKFEALYVKGSIFEAADSVQNETITYNPISSDLSWTYQGTGNVRRAGLGCPPSLPTTTAIQVGITKQNLFGVRASYSLTANLVNGQTVILYMNSTGAFPREKRHWTVTGTNSQDVGIEFTVPAGWYWNLGVTNGSAGSGPSISIIDIDIDP